MMFAVGTVSFTLTGLAQINDGVSASGFAYRFDSMVGVDNPTLTLYRGVTYIFTNEVVISHPLYIKTNVSAGTSSGVYTNGVSGNGSALVTFVVPNNAPNQLIYNCSVHSGFGMHGVLNISEPPVPPSGQIVLISLTPSNMTMKSIGSSGWKAFPEFSSNLLSGVWANVPNPTNSFANGTNTTTFDRLEAICGPNVFLRVRNQFP